MEAGRALAEAQGLNSIVARALLNMAGTYMSHDPRRAFELGIEGIALARRIGFRSFLATAAGNSLEVAADLGELDWGMGTGDELLALDFARSHRRSLMRGIVEVRLLRGEPVDDLLAEYAEVVEEDSDLQEVSNYEGAEAFRRFLSSDFAGAAAFWEKAARTVMLNASSDLPRAARAAIWAGDLPTAERLTAEFAKEWVHGRCAHARLMGLRAGLAATAGRRDDAITGYGAAIATLRELGLEVDAVQNMLDHGAHPRRDGSGGDPVARRSPCHDGPPPDARPQRPTRDRERGTGRSVGIGARRGPGRVVGDRGGRITTSAPTYPTCRLGIVWYAARASCRRPSPPTPTPASRRHG